MNMKCRFIIPLLTMCVFGSHQSYADVPVTSVDPIPDVRKSLPIGSVPMGDIESFTEYQLDLDMTEGPFKANWESIESNYPGTPDWLRDAKFGIWVHFGPQSAGQSGDWYARNLYKEDHKAYANHLKNFGHPSEVGYKEVLRDWDPEKLDPEFLTDLYHKAGARFLMIQGVHHDNYDLWNSKYQPWNSVNIGPHRDLLREWADACRKHDMRYGVTFHHEYTWWWWQTAFGADSQGERAGIPYDGHLTLADGKGKWWEGYDPRLLYGVDLREYETVDKNAHTPWSPPKKGIFSNHLDYAKWYAKQWAQRIMDVTENYDPDFIYTDGTVQGPFTGDGTGTGFKSNAMQHVMADFYNKVLKRRGKVDVFSIIKFRRPTNGAVNTAEFGFPDTINSSQPWIREAPVGDWFYAPGFTYDSGMMVRFIIESISRDGNAALNICLLPDGSIDPECVRMLEEVGEWMKRNGEAVYGSSAWHKLGEGVENEGNLRKLPGGGLGRKHAEFKFSSEDFRFTRGKNGNLYAFCMTVPDGGTELLIKSLAKGAKDAPDVSKVILLGHEKPLEWSQLGDGLSVTLPDDLSDFRSALVFRID
ncbi:MAG: alpha-L-fucosidase [Bacteroides sp.]|nr:alpha-L-fucosidase [Bacteroides sp.]